MSVPSTLPWYETVHLQWRVCCIQDIQRCQVTDKGQWRAPIDNITDPSAHEMSNTSVSATSLTLSTIEGTGTTMDEVLTSLSIWLDWTDFLGLGLQKNFLGTSYKFIKLCT
jgi:hypothetical protein